jgi:FkbM family methyltransferase
MIKSLLNKAFGLLGYQVIRANSVPPSDNPFEDMRRLMAATAAPVIFDVGAHHGRVSLHYRKLFPTATVYAFEPFPESFEQLKKNTAADPMIKAFNFGFSNVAGSQLFSTNASSATNSLFETDERGAAAWGKGVLETTGRITASFATIDQFVAEMKIPAVDILKLDVQGAEYLVLEGAAQTLGAGRVNLIYSEVITQPTYKNQKELHEVLGLFHNRGFRVHNIYDLSRTDHGDLRQIDVIFLRTNRKA